VSVTTRKTNWLKQNYEKLLLVVILLLLLCSAVFLVWQVKQTTDEQAIAPPPVQFAKAQSEDLAQLAQRLDVLTHSNAMVVKLGVMGDERRVACINPKCGKPIPYEAKECPYCSTKQPDDDKGLDLGGITDDWKKKHNFEVDDPMVANADPDKDGFTNLEEFRAGTDPLDLKSHPDVASKLRIWGTKQKAFKLRYMSSMPPITGSNWTYAINLRSGSTKFVKVDEVVDGYKVIRHEPKAAEGDVLVLEKGPEQLHLIKGRDLQQFEVIADLVLMLDYKRFNNITKESTVKIREVLYNVIDITTNAVTIRGPPPGNDVVVPLISDTERAEVTSALTEAATEVQPPATGTAAAQPPTVRTDMPPAQRMEGVPVRPRGEETVRPPVRPRGREQLKR
jgi:hypothetical protein